VKYERKWAFFKTERELKKTRRKLLTSRLNPKHL